jgi:hypothetical protein
VVSVLIFASRLFLTFDPSSEATCLRTESLEHINMSHHCHTEQKDILALQRSRGTLYPATHYAIDLWSASLLNIGGFNGGFSRKSMWAELEGCSIILRGGVSR